MAFNSKILSWKTSIIDVRLAYMSFLSRISMLIDYIIWSSNLFFFASSCFTCFFIVQVFQSSSFSGSRFFRVQDFQGPGFSESRFFRVCVQGPSSGSWSRVRVQGLGPGFRSSHLFEQNLLCWIIWWRIV